MSFVNKLPFVLLFLLSASRAHGVTSLDRCRDYSDGVRESHWKVFGTAFPWHYAVGQLQQESGCRNIMSNDGVGSQGLPQITWSVWSKPLIAARIPDLKTTPNQLDAQAVINKAMWDHAVKLGHPLLWVALQEYNGGGAVYKEITAANSDDHELAKLCCRRKDVVFNQGRVNESRRSACDINYEYPGRIAKYADRYRVGPDSKHFPMWVKQ